MRGDALQHYMYVAQEGSYEHVKSKMRQLYQIDMTPTTARTNARDLKHTEDESEEAFAKPLYKVIRMGYQHMAEVAMNQVAIDVFMQGCCNSEAKRAVQKDDPCNLSDAIQAMKQAIEEVASPSQECDKETSCLESTFEVWKQKQPQVSSRKLKEIKKKDRKDRRLKSKAEEKRECKSVETPSLSAIPEEMST